MVACSFLSHARFAVEKCHHDTGFLEQCGFSKGPFTLVLMQYFAVTHALPPYTLTRVTCISASPCTSCDVYLQALNLVL